MAAQVPDLPRVEQGIIDQTNAIRTQAKLGPVSVSPQLTEAARAYAKLLATTGQFTHTAGGQPTQRLVTVGYAACGFAENIAMRRDQNGFATQVLAKSVVDGWQASPIHARNLHNATMTEVGVGVAVSPAKAGEYITVQLFGRPRSQGLVFDIKNAMPTAVAVTFEGRSHTLAPNAVYTLRACSAGNLTVTTQSAAAPLMIHVPAAGGKRYTITAPSKIDVTARKP